MFKIQRWDRLRTKCFNFRFNKIRLGFQFNREYLGTVEGEYIATKFVLEIPFKPWEIRIIVPSIKLLEMVFINKTRLQSFGLGSKFFRIGR